MLKVYVTIGLLIYYLALLLRDVNSQFINTSLFCNYKLTNSSGVCKLLSDCQIIRDDIIKNQRLPQVSDFRLFQDTQPVVCCPKKTGQRNPGEISKIKCKQYSSYAFGEEKNECGHAIVKRIVGGETADTKEFAHMALVGVGKKPNIRWTCGGTIISEQYILTTAHCMGSQVGEANYVKVGITNINDTKNLQEIEIIERITHPDYTTTRVYNDIALVKLEKPIRLSQYARPACLNTERHISAEKGIAIGFGTTESGFSSDKLLKVTLGLVDFESCNATYSKNLTKKVDKGILDDSQLCAGSSGNYKNACAGDAEGPLQIYHNDDSAACMYDIIGVISFGPKNCGALPGVYTRVSHYVKWIEDTVWPKTQIDL